MPGANLELTDTSTNAVRRAITLESGAYSYPGLPFGEYKLLVAKQGFSSELFSSIQVQTGRTADIKATLKVDAVLAATQSTVAVAP